MKRNLNPPIRVNIGARAKGAEHFRSRAEKWAHSLLTMCAVVFLTKQSGAVKVRVLAATRLEARADREPGTSNGVVLRGTLRDDVGSPVPSSHVTISILAEGGRGPALPLPRALRCSPALAPDAHDPHIAPDEYVVDTDAAGSFCIRNELQLRSGVMRLHFQGSAFFEPSTAEVAFDLGRAAATVIFDPEPRVVSLDRPMYVQGLRVATLGLGRGDWHVTLRDERQKVLGGAAIAGDGYARIDVRTEELAGPGTGSLSAALDNVSLSVSGATHAVERHAHVALDLDGPPPEGYPDEGIAIAVRARSVRGDVPSGVVEVTIGDQPVGAARVQDGRALVLARFGAGRAKMTTAQLRYLPDTPWWEPGDPLILNVHVRSPNPWRRAPLVVLALALAAWMAREPLLARLRRPRRAPKLGHAAEDRQDMQVVRPRKESGDWAGRVIDAHDGYPLARAKVSIVVPVFPGAGGDGSGIVVTTDTSESGNFALPATSFRADARLRVEAPLHATFEEPLPPPAELAIPLISRRRRLLDRLVHWSTREWGHGVLSDPTPSQVVARAAAEMAPGDTIKRERADRVKSWARALERIAFDRAAVDKQAEDAVVAREPPPKGSYEDVTGAPDGGITKVGRPADN
jgi:hypothetical protein